MRSMRLRGLAVTAFALALALAGCVTLPSGPSVMALPGDGVSFDEFVADDDLCRSWAARRGRTRNVTSRPAWARRPPK